MLILMEGVYYYIGVLCLDVTSDKIGRWVLYVSLYIIILMLLAGISLKTQELYAIVFLARYLDLFTDFISVYNTVMKLVFIGSSLAIVWCMRMHRAVKRTYDKEVDTFRHYFLILASFILALLLHEKFTFQEVTIFTIFPSSILHILSAKFSLGYEFNNVFCIGNIP